MTRALPLEKVREFTIEKVDSVLLSIVLSNYDCATICTTFVIGLITKMLSAKTKYSQKTRILKYSHTSVFFY